MENIVIKNMSKMYGDQMIFEGADFVFECGSISCIMGESGIGKTTLLNIIMGLETVDKGQLTGIYDTTRISAVFQEDRLCENITPIANVMLTASKGITRKRVRMELERILPLQEIDKKTCRLSGGMKRRVEIVRAMLADSELIIMDEPFKGLDEDTKCKVIKYVKQEKRDRTIIITTHDKKETEMLEAQICLLTK